MPAHIRKGDMVFVRSGKDKGKTGEVLSVHPDTNPNRTTCVVKGVNIRTKHLKRTQQRPKGAMVKVELAINISKVSPVVDGKPTRVRFEIKPDGSKVRVAAKGGKELGAVSPGNAAAAPKKTTKKAK